MKFKQRAKSLPAVIVIPMIDIMFFLLVFFMVSTMHMTNVNTVPVKLGDMKGSVPVQDVAFAITIDQGGQYYVGDAKVSLPVLQQYAQKEITKNPHAMIILRTDGGSSYQAFSEVVDALKSVGVARFGIATETGEENAGR